MLATLSIKTLAKAIITVSFIGNALLLAIRLFIAKRNKLKARQFMYAKEEDNDTDMFLWLMQRTLLFAGIVGSAFYLVMAIME